MTAPPTPALRPDPLLERFRADVLANPHIRTLLARWDALALPDGWLVAGCLFQTVWNLQGGQPPTAAIKDYDLFYFDPGDLSREAEQRVQARVEAVLDDVIRDHGLVIECANQARVHLWYEDHFGAPCPPLQSSRDGIDRFLVPATCVGLRPGEVYAPHTLQPLYDGLLTMNPLTPHRALFERKVASYQARWPGLRVLADG